MREIAPAGLRRCVSGRSHPECVNPRPLPSDEEEGLAIQRLGLRRWVAANNSLNDSRRWREARAAIHHDGSVTVAAAIGGQREGV